MSKTKKSFVQTGTVRRFTCNCGCVDFNSFWQDRTGWGSSHLSSYDKRIDRFFDDLRGPEGRAVPVKITVTIEELAPGQHHLLNKSAFTGKDLDEGSPTSIEAQQQLLEPSEPTFPEPEERN